MTFSLLRRVTNGIGTSLAISPTFRTDKTIWAGFDGQGLWYSTDGGVQLDPRIAVGRRYPNIHALEVSPAYSSDNTLYVGGHHTDFGPFQIWAYAKWQSASSGLGSTAPYTVNAITLRRVGTTNTVWLGTEANGMYYSVGPPATCVAACDGGTQGTSKEVDALDVSSNSAPMLLEGRVDGLFQSTSSPTLGTTCSASSPLGAIQAIRFEPIWDGVTTATFSSAPPSASTGRGAPSRWARTAPTPSTANASPSPTRPRAPSWAPPATASSSPRPTTSRPAREPDHGPVQQLPATS